jgi:transcriptional regulator with XRE-family HTH domain
MEINKDEVGFRISNIRKRLGLNQELFGKKINQAHKSLVSKWEKGQSLPNNERLKLIAELGGISVDELLYGDMYSMVANAINAGFSEKIKEFENHNDTYDDDKVKFLKDNELTIKKNLRGYLEGILPLNNLSFKQIEDQVTLLLNEMIFGSPQSDISLLTRIVSELGTVTELLYTAYGKSDTVTQYFVVPNNELSPEIYDQLMPDLTAIEKKAWKLLEESKKGTEYE